MKKIIPELYSTGEKLIYYREKAPSLKSFDLNLRQTCDLDLLLDGSFNPLNGFLTKKDYMSVCENMLLLNGELWPIPINLDVSKEFADTLELGEEISLKDQEGVNLAILIVEDIWYPDKLFEAEKVFGTTNSEHPGVNYLLNKSKNVYVGGKIIGINKPNFYDFKHLRNSPNELRRIFNKLGWSSIVAFQTRNPLHRAHFELTLRASSENEANLLIHPVVGMTKPGDIDHFTRVRCYEAILKYYTKSTTCISLLNLAMRMAGPKEAILHGLIRANYGCTHFIVGRDHAGPGLRSDKVPFYPEYEAQDLFIQFQDKINIQKKLDYGNANLVIAVPDDWIDVQTIADLEEISFDIRSKRNTRLRVATKYPNLTNDFLISKGVTQYKLIPSLGATETYPFIGSSEIITDITSTGKTLADNNLRVLKDGLILSSKACLFIAKKKAAKLQPFLKSLGR